MTTEPSVCQEVKLSFAINYLIQCHATDLMQKCNQIKRVMHIFVIKEIYILHTAFITVFCHL